MSRIHPRVLLVEGQDEVRVLPWLLELAGVAWPKENVPVLIKEFEGVENILKAGLIEAELKASGLEALGILVDADSKPDLRWESLRSRLAQTLVGLPDVLPQSGLILDTPTPRMGVWIMPDNVGEGMLETMLLKLRVSGNPLESYAADSCAEAKVLGAPYRDVHRHKAELHTWLSWQDPPGSQIHIAVQKQLLLPSASVTGTFVTWFRSLYGV